MDALRRALWWLEDISWRIEGRWDSLKGRWRGDGPAPDSGSLGAILNFRFGEAEPVVIQSVTLPEPKPKIPESFADWIIALARDIQAKGSVWDGFNGDRDFHAQWLAARGLATQIADETGMTFEESWEGLGSIPDNLLYLLDTPEGWGVIAHWVAGDRGSSVQIAIH